jgi:hypothetical protein
MNKVTLRRNRVAFIPLQLSQQSATIPLEYRAFKVTIKLQYPIFLSDFNHVQIFATDYHRSFQYQISHKSVQWEPR